MRFFIFALLVISSQITSAQSGFERVYGGLLPDWFRAVLILPDGSLVAGGGTRSFGLGNVTYCDGYVVKMDSSGNELWYQTFGETYNDEVYSLLPKGSNYLAAGYNIAAGSSYYDFYTAEYDAQGNFVQEKFYGGIYTEYCFDALRTQNNETVLSGISNSFTSGGYDFFVVKTDSTGLQTDQANFGGIFSETLSAIIQTNDGGYVMVGTSSSGIPGLDFYLVKTDGDFNLVWEKYYGGTLDEIAYDAAEDADGNLWILGSWQNSPDSADIVLLKIDAAGNNPIFYWPGIHAGDLAFQLHPLPSGELLLAGYSHTDGKQSELLLEKISLQGDTLWTRRLGGTKEDLAFAVTTDANGNIYVAGQTEGFGNYSVDAFLARLNADGEIPCPDYVSFEASEKYLCEDDLVFFTNTTVSSAPFVWLINGQQLNSIDAAWYFPEPGTFEATLSACNVAASDTITILAKPGTHFTYSASGNTVQFTLDAGMDVSSIEWNFGDGSPVNTTDTNPVHTYAVGAPYWVVLAVTDPDGCDSSYVEQIAWITGTESNAEEPVSFYPNPVNSLLHVNVPASACPFSLSIRNIHGQAVVEEQFANPRPVLQLPPLPAGAYLIAITGPEVSYNFSILIAE